MTLKSVCVQKVKHQKRPVLLLLQNNYNKRVIRELAHSAQWQHEGQATTGRLLNDPLLNQHVSLYRADDSGEFVVSSPCGIPVDSRETCIIWLFGGTRVHLCVLSFPTVVLRVTLIYCSLPWTWRHLYPHTLIFIPSIPVDNPHYLSVLTELFQPRPQKKLSRCLPNADIPKHTLPLFTLFTALSQALVSLHCFPHTYLCRPLIKMNSLLVFCVLWSLVRTLKSSCQLQSGDLSSNKK